MHDTLWSNGWARRPCPINASGLTCDWSFTANNNERQSGKSSLESKWLSYRKSDKKSAYEWAKWENDEGTCSGVEPALEYNAAKSAWSIGLCLCNDFMLAILATEKLNIQMHDVNLGRE